MRLSIPVYMQEAVHDIPENVIVHFAILGGIIVAFYIVIEAVAMIRARL